MIEVLTIFRQNPILIVLLTALLVFAGLAGCKPEPEEKDGSAKVNVSKEEEPAKPEETQGKTEEQQESAKAQEEPDMKKVKLYFADQNSEYLVVEEREVFDSSRLVINILEELVRGPQNEAHLRTLPAGTKILATSATDDTLVVNFSREFVDNQAGGSASEIMTVYSVVNTVTEFPGFKRVKFVVEGQELESLSGHLDLTQPIERDETFIKK